MSGIVHKIEETLHMGGNKKDQEHKGESHGDHQYGQQGDHHQQQQQHYGVAGTGGVYGGGEHGGHVQEHRPGEQQQHKEGLVDKIKDKIHGGGAEGVDGEKKKKKDKKKGEHGKDHGHDSSSSSDSD
ncbi:hypothetical protein PIB30_073712 [Stylosanthes scabra]|uniref:Uncharacterized protein n=1 Tax=Stylosanthes scabra TaxID=79078 RepID=A0ABU6RPV6_9FABA|nr:hypothetical protein [Stylosanthes scabra]